jgi:hypothetical protein
MKATVDILCGRYRVVGLHEATTCPTIFDNDKETYELVTLHSFCRKSYKTLDNAIRAIQKNNMEYIPIDTINTFCGWD